ncbi:hypothetical protein COLO4_04605 [Corchorus olitorius]|uniref:Uncharacterized protein n=1 Tax=Corchorus olitorius TaxID=93759 RepID=A0A1R3KTC0_9ROSI|nr:hypothetical protein COLO4_04605 [Corchorus olitorius]
MSSFSFFLEPPENPSLPQQRRHHRLPQPSSPSTTETTANGT